ncbi:hypothetical protein ACRAWD_14945 [Caulobacter segnis]
MLDFDPKAGAPLYPFGGRHARRRRSTRPYPGLCAGDPRPCRSPVGRRLHPG